MLPSWRACPRSGVSYLVIVAFAGDWPVPLSEVGLGLAGGLLVDFTYRALLMSLDYSIPGGARTSKLSHGCFHWCRQIEVESEGSRK